MGSGAAALWGSGECGSGWSVAVLDARRVCAPRTASQVISRPRPYAWGGPQLCPKLGINLGILKCASLQETFITNRRWRPQQMKMLGINSGILACVSLQETFCNQSYSSTWRLWLHTYLLRRKVLTLDHYAPLHLALSYSTPKSFPSLPEFFATFYSYSFTSKHFIPTETSQLTMHTSHLSISDNVITVEEWDRHKDTIKNLFVKTYTPRVEENHGERLRLPCNVCIACNSRLVLILYSMMLTRSAPI